MTWIVADRDWREIDRARDEGIALGLARNVYSRAVYVAAVTAAGRPVELLVIRDGR